MAEIQMDKMPYDELVRLVLLILKNGVPTGNGSGATPMFEIQSGVLHVSYDDGATWAPLGTVRGNDGRGISRIERTSTGGGANKNVDTYQITYSDGTGQSYQITNGIDGEDGLSVFYADVEAAGSGTINIAVSAIVNRGYRTVKVNDLIFCRSELHRVTATDGASVTCSPIRDFQGIGIASIDKIGTNGNVDTYAITLTDNKTKFLFTVTNGTNGKDGKSAYAYAQEGGYTGTEAEFAQLLGNIKQQISQLSSEIADIPNNNLLLEKVADKVPYVKVAEPPTFVDSVDEMTDISKMYVLKSDAMFYSYKEHTTVVPGGTVANFTNKVPTSIDENRAIYNGTGYKDNTRLNSEGKVKEEQDGHSLFGFIPAKGGDIIRFKSVSKNGADVIWYDTTQSANYIAAYDANFTPLYVGNSAGGYKTSDFVDSMSLDGSVSVIKLKDVANMAYIRMSVYDGYSSNDIVGKSAIITVNEEITYTTTEESTTTTYSWEPTGISYNQPADYEHRVIAMENELEVLLNGTF